MASRHAFNTTRGSTPASNAGSVREGSFPVKAAIVLALAALADWLFYRHGIGISAAIFAVAVASGSLLANLATLNRKQVLLAVVLLLAALVPAIEEFNVASLAFMVLALGTGLLLTTNRDQHSLGERAAALCDLYLVGPFRFFRDAIGGFNLPALKTGCRGSFRSLGHLRVSAGINNPCREVDGLLNLATRLTVLRVILWIVALSIVWPYPRPMERQAGMAGWPKRRHNGEYHRATRLLRCCDHPAFMILFNLLFAVQPLLMPILRQRGLPADISYAHAHRGAHPSLSRRLLAAGLPWPCGVRPAEHRYPADGLFGWRKMSCWCCHRSCASISIFRFIC
jgi:hypothetical protein